jgi:hypothetical protein
MFLLIQISLMPTAIAHRQCLVCSNSHPFNETISNVFAFSYRNMCRFNSGVRFLFHVMDMY